MQVIELNWFNRFPLVSGGQVTNWGSPDTSMLLTEDEETGDIASSEPCADVQPEDSRVVEVLSDSIDRELDGAQNRCLRMRVNEAKETR